MRFGYVMDIKKQLEEYLFDLEKVTLEARNIFGGNYNVLSNEDFSEQAKIMKMFWIASFHNKLIILFEFCSKIYNICQQ